MAAYLSTNRSPQAAELGGLDVVEGQTQFRLLKKPGGLFAVRASNGHLLFACSKIHLIERDIDRMAFDRL